MTNAELYRRWLGARGLVDATAIVQRGSRLFALSLPTPDERGVFWRGMTPCVLPYLRVFWKPDDDETPPWEPDTWSMLTRRDGDAEVPSRGGLFRFLRADQLLACVDSLVTKGDDLAPFVSAVRTLLGACLVPLDEPLRERLEVLDRRVETVRLRRDRRTWRWSRRSRWFPDDLRESLVAGLDAVHTPENTRAGLTRYVCEGWRVDDRGQLVAPTPMTEWGPSTARIPFAHHDAPRRLMLGASLQARAVSLREAERPEYDQNHGAWMPPGRMLRASFAMHGGWTHEDAIVVSESAAGKLSRGMVRDVRVLIPAVATRIDIPDVTAGPVAITRGQVLARAHIDAFALGLRRRDAEDEGADDGWVEVALPSAAAPFHGTLVAVTRRPENTPFWRELITFTIERAAPLRIGDKLSTPHGIKGVVSRILPDAEMPSAPDGPADIVLSPLGVIRRGAMGQLREAAGGAATAPPRAGRVFVMRQAQDAELPERCRVRGRERRGAHLHGGQRYGEMEMWALMAHGAHDIAGELLSTTRSIAPWMDWEARLGAADHRTLATRALNRYLAIAGVQVERGRFVAGKEPAGAFEIAAKWTGRGDPRDSLDDAEYFRVRGGLGQLSLGRRIRVELADDDDKPNSRQAPVLELDHVYILPPWLRPSSPFHRHELTRAYWRLMSRLAWFQTDGDAIAREVSEVVRLTLHERKGAGGFLRREILGRRLTRSARAVIVPRPDLRIDQVAIPAWMADELFAGLGAASRRLVLVNRNPTLHRRGLLALRPVIGPADGPSVVGMPLGILRSLGADFDGDQASIVALETDAALAQAERLLPGAPGLRCDELRIGGPAFALAGELADRARELAHAEDGGATQEAWCEAHQALQEDRIAQLDHGWDHPLVVSELGKHERLWGVETAEGEWRKLVRPEMETVLRGVRRKGQLGGVVRRQLYRRTFSDAASFPRVVQALQAVTETLTQTALSVKSGPGAATFDAATYFAEPREGDALLAALDQAAGRQDTPFRAAVIGDLLAASQDPRGLLAWMARPDAESLGAERAHSDASAPDDPRIAWFLA